MSNYRIAIVSPYPLNPSKITGGIEAVVYNLVNGLERDHSFEIHVITIDYDHDSDYKPDGQIHLHTFHGEKNRNRIKIFRPERVWINSTIRDIQPDLVHVHGTDIYGYATRNLNFPVLLTVHGVLSKEAKINEKRLKLKNRTINAIKNKFNYYFEYKTLQRAKHIIAISPYTYQQIKERTDAEFYFIDNPVDERFFELQNRIVPNRFLFVGMIRARKGLIFLLHSIKKVIENYPKIELHLVGKIFEPEYYQLLRAYIHDNYLENNVIYHGQISDENLFEEFEECNALILPSIEESSPMVIEQAMAAGKAVIATNVGGIPFLVEHGKSGFLVTYGNVLDLSKYIEGLYRNPSKSIEMGRIGKAVAEKRFKNKEIIEKTKSVYLKIIKNSIV